MKDLAKGAAVRMCIYFTAAMIVWLIAGLAFVGPTEGIVVSISLFAACVLMAFLQAFWFTDKLLRNPSYPIRILGFGITGFAALATCAWFGGWMPHDILEAWITFTAIYLILLVAFTILFSFIYRQKLAQYSAALRRFQGK